MATIITGGQIIDVVGQTAVVGALAIEDGVIAEVIAGEYNKTGAGGDAVIDATGRSVLPGLVDSHLHLCEPLSAEDPVGDHLPVTDYSSAMAAMYGLANARRMLHRGITTVRDLGSHGRAIFAVKRLIESGEAKGPRIAACGQAISTTGGHFLLGAVEADGAAGVRKATRLQLSNGADLIKLMASGGGITNKETPLTVLMTKQELEAGISTASAAGKHAAVHALNPEAARSAIEAGARSIEHGLLLNTETLMMMRDRGVTFVPTMWVYEQAAAIGADLGIEPDRIASVQTRVAPHRRRVQEAAEMGVDIAAGTDSGRATDHGQALFWELAWMVHAGLTQCRRYVRQQFMAPTL